MDWNHTCRTCKNYNELGECAVWSIKKDGNRYVVTGKHKKKSPVFCPFPDFSCSKHEEAACALLSRLGYSSDAPAAEH